VVTSSAPRPTVVGAATATAASRWRAVGASSVRCAGRRWCHWRRIGVGGRRWHWGSGRLRRSPRLRARLPRSACRAHAYAQHAAAHPEHEGHQEQDQRERGTAHPAGARRGGAGHGRRRRALAVRIRLLIARW
jgi:hypothetical protein